MMQTLERWCYHTSHTSSSGKKTIVALACFSVTSVCEININNNNNNNNNVLHIYSLITHLQGGNQAYMELGNRTVGLRQQIQHSHHAEIPIQNSQSHSKCTLLCNRSYAPHRLQHPLVSDVIHERINKHHIKIEAHPNPLLESPLQPTNNGRLKRCWPFDLQGT